ncbi:MAG: MT-A70 family methyltransferase [Archangium sp.]
MNADLFAPAKQYAAGIADPSWMERGGGQVKRGADAHYDLMPTKEICALPVRDLFLPNAHLYLWVTNNFLPDGLEVMAAWGFRYVTNCCWGKVNERGVVQQGLGQYFRGAHELLLFGVRGSLPYRTTAEGKRAQFPSLVLAPRTEHSRKPDVFYDVVERISAGPYLELFARRRRPGWDAWGNEVEGSIQLAAPRSTHAEANAGH